MYVVRGNKVGRTIFFFDSFEISCPTTPVNRSRWLAARTGGGWVDNFSGKFSSSRFAGTREKRANAYETRRAKETRVCRVVGAFRLREKVFTDSNKWRTPESVRL